MHFAHHARRILSGLGLTAALTLTAAAQGTTGVAGVNDYTVGGMIPGSSSCTLLFPVPAGPTVFSINTAPGAPVVFFFNLNCPCKACLFPWVPATCGMPPLTCFTPSNQAFELDTSSGICTLLSAATTANAAGNASITINLPPTIRFSTQGVLLHPCDASNLIFTQAYNVSVP